MPFKKAFGSIESMPIIDPRIETYLLRKFQIFLMSHFWRVPKREEIASM
jgi:hypothetical protein